VRHCCSSTALGRELRPLCLRVTPTLAVVRLATEDPSLSKDSRVLSHLGPVRARAEIYRCSPSTLDIRPLPRGDRTPEDRDAFAPRKTRFGSPLVLSRVHWVEPKLVAEITYLTWTADNLLRHTVYMGLREDKPADQVRRE
jgi:ATP dependent DNA ligase C terminal region